MSAAVTLFLQSLGIKKHIHIFVKHHSLVLNHYTIYSLFKAILYLEGRGG